MNRLERTLLWSSSLLMAATGLAYAWMKYLLTTDDPYAVINHPWQPWMLKLHIVSAPLLVFAFGLVFGRHVLGQWRNGRAAGRRTGAITVVALVPLILSGYLVQVVTHDRWLWWAAAVHVAAGTVYFVGFATHRTLARVGVWRRGEDATRTPRPDRARGRSTSTIP